jgi:hypothetical protein
MPRYPDYMGGARQSPQLSGRGLCRQLSQGQNGLQKDYQHPRVPTNGNLAAHSNDCSCPARAPRLVGSNTEAPPVWVRFPSPAPLPGNAGLQDWVKTLILWESVGNGRRFGGGLVSSHIPTLPHHSYVQSHAASSKNNVCDSHTFCAASVATAGGRNSTRCCPSRTSAYRAHASHC